MSDLIQLRIGERPWLPTPTTEPIEIFDRYDMPTSGLILQAGTLYVFDCLEGHLMEANVWVYARVESKEAEALQAAEGDGFTESFSQAFPGKEIMATLAVHGRIRSGAPVDAREIDAKGLPRAVLEELTRGLELAGEAEAAIKQLVSC